MEELVTVAGKFCASACLLNPFSIKRVVNCNLENWEWIDKNEEHYKQWFPLVVGLGWLRFTPGVKDGLRHAWLNPMLLLETADTVVATFGAAMTSIATTCNASTVRKFAVLLTLLVHCPGHLAPKLGGQMRTQRQATKHACGGQSIVTQLLTTYS